MDRILIQDISVQCIIGTNADERVRKQEVLINVAIECDLSRAGTSDRIEDTLNYKSLTRRIVTLVERSEYLLIERLAAKVGELCLADVKAKAVTVRVDKPGALTRARSVAVELRQER